MDIHWRHFARFKLPPLSPEAMRGFDALVLDPSAGGRQCYRRFSQFKLRYEHGDWRTEILPHRPFVEVRGGNGLAGAITRDFEPVRFDPTPQVGAGARAGCLDRTRLYQASVHQVRIITDRDIPGVAVPEGPWRDGHDFVMNAVVRRHNITGGVSRLMPTGGGTPFFEDVLRENEAIIVAEERAWHNVTDILPGGPGRGHRDMIIVCFNTWERRRYGVEYERRLGVLASEEALAA